MLSHRLNVLITAIIFCIIFSGQIFAQQNLPFIRVSPQTKVVQNISFATVEIDYSRPGELRKSL